MSVLPRQCLVRGILFLASVSALVGAVRCVCATRVLIGLLHAFFVCVCMCPARFYWLAAHASVCVLRALWLARCARFFLLACFAHEIRSKTRVIPVVFTFTTAAKNCFTRNPGGFSRQAHNVGGWVNLRLSPASPNSLYSAVLYVVPYLF